MGKGDNGFGFGGTGEVEEADAATFDSDTTGSAPAAGEPDGRQEPDVADKDEEIAGHDRDVDVNVDADKPAAKAEKADDDDSGDEKPDGKLPKGIERRIARANRQREAAREEAEMLRKENEELKAKPAVAAEPAKLEKPNAADFDDYEEYTAAKAMFDRKQAEIAAGKTSEPEKAKEEEKSAPKADAELVSAVTEIEATLGDEHKDIFTAVRQLPNLNVTRDMVIAIADLDYPEAVLQAFLDKPELSNEIADLPTATDRLKRLIKMDVPLKAKPAATAEEAKAAEKAAAATEQKRLTGAPPPIDTTNGNAAGSRDYDSMSYSEFEKTRNEEDAKSKDYW